ncbi:MAG: PIN domain-containing protein [Thermomicrobiales bacterium]
MMFLDTNIFLRYLATPTTPDVQLLAEKAHHLFAQIKTGEAEATTSEVVIHEVCFILRSRKHYGSSVAEVTQSVAAVLAWPGMTFPMGDKEIYLRALNLWSQRPKLGFADSVIAARCERSGHELATFDRHFRDLPFLDFWQPESSVPNEP